MIEKKYGDLNGTIAMVELTKGLTGLGLSLAGNKDRKKMSVFVCGMHPKGSAFKDGRIQVGDEILEVSVIFFYFLSFFYFFFYFLFYCFFTLCHIPKGFSLVLVFFFFLSLWTTWIVLEGIFPLSLSLSTFRSILVITVTTSQFTFSPSSSFPPWLAESSYLLHIIH